MLTFPALRDTVKHLLEKQGMISNVDIYQLAQDDMAMTVCVRQDLIYRGIAIDKIDLTQPGLLWQIGIQQEVEYDVFVSYANYDNAYNQVDEVVETIRRLHFQQERSPLRLFYDREQSRGWDDWEKRLLVGMRSARVMVAMVSPAYFQSAYCRKEWEEYCKREMELSLAQEGIVPLYIIRVEEFDEDAENNLTAWYADLKNRAEWIDIRDWWTGGRPLTPENESFIALERACHRRLVRVRQSLSSRTNIPPHNPVFCGRLSELKSIYEYFEQQTGKAVGLWGMAGMGKSSLAFEFAHAYGYRYTGGRYLLSATDTFDVVEAIAGLADVIGIALTTEERKDAVVTYQRIIDYWEEVYKADTSKRVLLVFDHVTQPDCFSYEFLSQLLPECVEVLFTSQQAFSEHSLIHSMEIGTLSTSEALQLFSQHRPFLNEAEQIAARTIIEEHLQGFTFAIEVVAIYLLRHPQVRYEEYLQELQTTQIKALDKAGQADEVQLARHRQSVISQLLTPTLELLTDIERQALAIASWFPPTFVVIPWIESLLSPEYDWEKIWRRLGSFGLITPTTDNRIVRMHQLVQGIVQFKWESFSNQWQPQLNTKALERAQYLSLEWYLPQNRWEIEPTATFTEWAIKHQRNVTALANFAHISLIEIGQLERSQRLLDKAAMINGVSESSPDEYAKILGNSATLALLLGDFEHYKRQTDASLLVRPFEAMSPTDQAIFCHNTATFECEIGNLTVAAQWSDRAFSLIREIIDENHPDMAQFLISAALIQKRLGNFQNSESILSKVIGIVSVNLSPTHPYLMTAYNNLAHLYREQGLWHLATQAIEQAMAIADTLYEEENLEKGLYYNTLGLIERDRGMYSAAKQWFEKAIVIEQKNYISTHPKLGIRYNNLALIEQNLGNYEQARFWIQKSIEIVEIHYPLNHVEVGIRYSNCALIERDLGKMYEAYQWMTKAHEVFKTVLDENHPHWGTVYINLGIFNREVGQIVEAETFLHQAITFYQTHKEHPHLADAYNQLGLLKQDVHQYAEAKAHFLKAIEIDNNYLSSDNPNRGIRFYNYACLEFQLGNLAAALIYVQKAYDLFLHCLGDSHGYTQSAQKLFDRITNTVT